MGLAAGRLIAEGRVSEAAVHGRKLIRLAQLDYCVIVAIIALMVLKPGWADFAGLGLVAAWLAVAAIVLFAPRRAPGALPQA